MIVAQVIQQVLARERQRYSESTFVSDASNNDAISALQDAEASGVTTGLLSSTFMQETASQLSQVGAVCSCSHGHTDQLISHSHDSKHYQHLPQNELQHPREGPCLYPHPYEPSMETLNEESHDGWPLPKGPDYEQAFRHPLWSSTPTLVPSDSRMSYPHGILGIRDSVGKETKYDLNLVSGKL